MRRTGGDGHERPPCADGARPPRVAFDGFRPPPNLRSQPLRKTGRPGAAGVRDDSLLELGQTPERRVMGAGDGANDQG